MDNNLKDSKKEARKAKFQRRLQRTITIANAIAAIREITEESEYYEISDMSDEELARVFDDYSEDDLPKGKRAQ